MRDIAGHRTVERERAEKFFRDQAEAIEREISDRHYSSPDQTNSTLTPTAIAEQWAYNYDWLSNNRTRFRTGSVAISPPSLTPAYTPPAKVARIFLPGLFEVNWSIATDFWIQKHVDRKGARPREFKNSYAAWLYEHSGRDRNFVVPPLPMAPVIVSSLPTSLKEFSSVFEGHAPSGLELAAYKKADASLRRSGDYYGGDLDKAFGSKNRVLVMVGHNDGGNLVLTNGTKVSLEELSRRCEAGEKICIFLVCNGKGHLSPRDIAYGRPITPTEAAKIVSDIKSTLARRADKLKSIDTINAMTELLYVASDHHGTRYYFRRRRGVHCHAYPLCRVQRQ